jgi:hypothetical protein
MLSALTVLALFAMAGQAGEAKPKQEGMTDPKGVPLELKVVAKKDTYILDLGGKTPVEYRQLLAEAAKTASLPPAPAVDLVVELRNSGDKGLQVWIGGDDNEPVLCLVGEGARNLTTVGLFGDRGRLGDEQAPRAALGIVFGHQAVGQTSGPGPATGHGCQDDAVRQNQIVQTEGSKENAVHDLLPCLVCG